MLSSDNLTISVLMSVFDGEKYLQESIESILNQTYKNFEFIIINDGSQDSSKKIIQTYKDPRIKLINNKKNIGLAASLNKGIKLASGRYIARMDADDISHEERLKKQVEFMESHENIEICGTFIELKTGSSTKKLTFPTKDGDIKAHLIFRNPLAHPSVIMRKKIFDEKNNFYNEAYEASQDYELWSRLRDTCNFSNIEECLLIHRVHQKSVSENKKRLQEKNASKVRLNLLKEMNLDPDEVELNIHNMITHNKMRIKSGEFNRAAKWLIKLAKANKKYQIYSNYYFNKLLLIRYLSLVKYSKLKLT